MGYDAQSPQPLGGCEVFDLRSAAVGEEFRIFVGHSDLGAGDAGDGGTAHRGGPAQAMLIVTDGNGWFGMATDSVRLMRIPALVPPMLVVGVGYPHATGVIDTIGSRTRDLSPTPWDLFPGSGGGDAFLRFLREELLPLLRERYPSGADRTIYFGHSLGGTFGTHVLLTQPDTFDHYLLSAPGVYWGNYLLADRERQWAAGHDDLAADVFFGIGALETDEGRRLEAARLPDGDPFKPPSITLDMVADLRGFIAALRGRGYPGLRLAETVYPDEFHATVASLVLTHGLRHVFGTGIAGQRGA
jgi:hypothetical protein